MKMAISRYEIYQRGKQSRDEMRDMIVKSLPDASDKHIRRLYFFMYGAGLLKDQEAGYERKD